MTEREQRNESGQSMVIGNTTPFTAYDSTQLVIRAGAGATGNTTWSGTVPDWEHRNIPPHVPLFTNLYCDDGCDPVVFANVSSVAITVPDLKTPVSPNETPEQRKEREYELRSIAWHKDNGWAGVSYGKADWDPRTNSYGAEAKLASWQGGRYNVLNTGPLPIKARRFVGYRLPKDDPTKPYAELVEVTPDTIADVTIGINFEKLMLTDQYQDMFFTAFEHFFYDLLFGTGNKAMFVKFQTELENLVNSGLGIDAAETALANEKLEMKRAQTDTMLSEEKAKIRRMGCRRLAMAAVGHVFSKPALDKENPVFMDLPSSKEFRKAAIKNSFLMFNESIARIPLVSATNGNSGDLFVADQNPFAHSIMHEMC